MKPLAIFILPRLVIRIITQTTTLFKKFYLMSTSHALNFFKYEIMKNSIRFQNFNSYQKGSLLLSFELRKKVPSMFKPFTPTSDQDRISPYKINTLSSRQVMRIEKNINHGIIS